LPPSCLKGLIAGELRRYWLQNNPDDFKEILTNFIRRLLLRGHTINNISPILLNATALLEKKHHVNKTQPTIGEDTLFIHRVFHPHGISQSNICNLHNKILQPHLDFDRMTVAMACPANLQDILAKAALIPPDNLNINHLIEQMNAPLPSNP
jgi:hypothetical protein